MRYILACVLLINVLLISCNGNGTAQIWTDHPEFAIYGAYFNTVQNQYKVSVKYYEFPAEELAKFNNTPDIVVASWLKNSQTGTYFRTLDNIFKPKKLSKDIFDLKLFEIGRIDKSLYLLPVSYNIPALIFSKERAHELSNPFTVGFDEIKTLSKNYNTETRGAYTRMGFSPLWNDNFLFTVSVLSGASFREAQPLVWDSNALENSSESVYKWTHEINTNSQAEEDFTFKYFFEPPEKLIQSGRIFFSYMESREFFTLSSDSKNNLDFRWIMENNKVPIAEDLVLMGIPKKAKSQKAARAFIQWFFQIENQRLLLEYSRVNRISENVFGICGGFSSLNLVTEQVFPRFYPELLGRMPPSENFLPPGILPGNWAAIKERVVLPYLHDRSRKERADETYPLSRRLSDWMRINR
jgi:ABC-type glycerol-3-phosphate transport system substrate-binding protein